MKEQWPTSVELEKWLMNTAKEADAGAVFLRRMLNMNPTYGSYLSGDTEIAGIVQLFAKRFRAKIMQAEAPIQPATLYEPLCEVVWRVIGHVLHSIVDLEDVENSPFPREAVGQVKMLLQTNVELSKKFNEMRRAYLRELSEHRDRQRELSQKQKDLLHDLKEEPIMFYEPLEFVLDEATKDFVREVVEERVKLGFRASAAKKMAGGENEVQDLDVEELQAALKQALNDAKQLRIAHAKEMDKSKRSEDALRRAKDEMELERRKTEGVRLQLEEAQKEILDLKDEIETLSKGLQNKEGADKKAKLSAELADTQRRSLNEALEKLSLAEERIAQLEQDKKDLALELAKAKYRIEQLEGNSDSNNKDKALAEKEAEAARQLRERISSLEKENKQLREQLQSLSAKLGKPKPEEAPAPAPIVAGPSEDDLKEAVAKAAKEYELKIKALQTEIKRLKEELESMNSGGDGQRAKDMEKIAALKLEVEELKAKLQEKDDKYNDLAEEHERLQEHVKRLMAKLEELGAKDFVEEMKDQINLNPLEGRKRKKLNAFDRLYHDAQRRILDMRAKAKSAARSEEVSLVEAVKLVKDKAALRQAEALRMLQAHHSQTRSRFHDALQKFTLQHGRGGEAEGGGEAAGGTDAAAGTGGDDVSPKIGGLLSLKLLKKKAQEMGESLSDHGEATLPDHEEIGRMRQENEDLRDQVQQLTARLAQLEHGAGAGGSGSHSAQRALTRAIRHAAKAGRASSVFQHVHMDAEARADAHSGVEDSGESDVPQAPRQGLATVSPFAAAFMGSTRNSPSAAESGMPARRASLVSGRRMSLVSGGLMAARSASPQLLEDAEEDLVEPTGTRTSPAGARSRAARPAAGRGEAAAQRAPSAHQRRSTPTLDGAAAGTWRPVGASQAARSAEGGFWSGAGEAAAAPSASAGTWRPAGAAQAARSADGFWSGAGEAAAAAARPARGSPGRPLSSPPGGEPWHGGAPARHAPGAEGGGAAPPSGRPALPARPAEPQRTPWRPGGAEKQRHDAAGAALWQGDEDVVSKRTTSGAGGRPAAVPHRSPAPASGSPGPGGQARGVAGAQHAAAGEQPEPPPLPSQPAAEQGAPAPGQAAPPAQAGAQGAASRQALAPAAGSGAGPPPAGGPGGAPAGPEGGRTNAAAGSDARAQASSVDVDHLGDVDGRRVGAQVLLPRGQHGTPELGRARTTLSPRGGRGEPVGPDVPQELVVERIPTADGGMQQRAPSPLVPNSAGLDTVPPWKRRPDTIGSQALTVRSLSPRPSSTAASQPDASPQSAQGGVDDLQAVGGPPAGSTGVARQALASRGEHPGPGVQPLPPSHSTPALRGAAPTGWGARVGSASATMPLRRDSLPLIRTAPASVFAAEAGAAARPRGRALASAPAGEANLEAPQPPPSQQRAAAPPGPPEGSYIGPRPNTTHWLPRADVASQGRLSSVALEPLPQGAHTRGAAAGPAAALPTAEMVDHASFGVTAPAGLSPVPPWLRDQQQQQLRGSTVGSTSTMDAATWPEWSEAWRRHTAGDWKAPAGQQSYLPAGRDWGEAEGHAHGTLSRGSPLRSASREPSPPRAPSPQRLPRAGALSKAPALASLPRGRSRAGDSAELGVRVLASQSRIATSA